MPDYKKMYYLLFNEITNTIEQLQIAQQRAEELYMDSEDTPAKIVKTENDTCNPHNCITYKLKQRTKKP